MHISFSNPEVPEQGPGARAHVVASERELVRTRTMADEKNANKPAEILEKIIEGGLSNYFKASTLLEQPYIREPKQTIARS